MKNDLLKSVGLDLMQKLEQVYQDQKAVTGIALKNVKMGNNVKKDNPSINVSLFRDCQEGLLNIVDKKIMVLNECLRGNSEIGNLEDFLAVWDSLVLSDDSDLTKDAEDLKKEMIKEVLKRTDQLQKKAKPRKR